MLPASRGGFVGGCRFKQGAVQRATLEEETWGVGGGFVSWDGETCIANTGLVDRNSGRRLTTPRQKGEERQVEKKIERKQVSCFGQSNSGWSMPNSLNPVPVKSTSFSCPMSRVGRCRLCDDFGSIGEKCQAGLPC